MREGAAPKEPPRPVVDDDNVRQTRPAGTLRYRTAQGHLTEPVKSHGFRCSWK